MEKLLKQTAKENLTNQQINDNNNTIGKGELENNNFKWLTEHSRQFLAAGYINPEVSAETRIREIADRAEEILGIKGYGDKFFKYMSEGFYSLASPVWSNFGKKEVFQLAALDLTSLMIWVIFYIVSLKLE